MNAATDANSARYIIDSTGFSIFWKQKSSKLQIGVG
jgi:hypothetical protein